MSILDVLILSVAAPALFGLVCRLSMLDIRAHKPLPILMHASLAIAVAWAGCHACLGDGTVGDLAVCVGALSWIAISLVSWSDGVPDHFASEPYPIDELHWPHISGGKE